MVPSQRASFVGLYTHYSMQHLASFMHFTERTNMFITNASWYQSSGVVNNTTRTLSQD
jgi:hypothetical protein